MTRAFSVDSFRGLNRDVISADDFKKLSVRERHMLVRYLTSEQNATTVAREFNLRTYEIERWLGRGDIAEILGKSVPRDLMGMVLDIEERYGFNAEQVREIARKSEERKKQALAAFEEGEE